MSERLGEKGLLELCYTGPDVDHPGVRVCESRIVDQILSTDRATQSAPEAVLLHHVQCYPPTVRGGVGVYQRIEGSETVAAGHLGDARSGGSYDGHLHRPQGGTEQ